jgi:tetratricopeptide (TPR) repeat protein
MWLLSAMLGLLSSWSGHAVAGLAGVEVGAVVVEKRLTAGDLAVRPSLTLSYRGLGPAEVKAFRLLGLLNMPEVSVDLAAALTGVGWEETEEVLERLVDVALLETPAPDRYRFHDLVRLFALERAEAEEAPEARHAAIAAAVAWYVDRAVEGAILLGPSRTAGAGGSFPDFAVALRWFETERENLVRAVARADEYDLGTACWKLADALFRFFELRRYLADWQQVNERALSAARRAGERGIEGQFLNGLGCALREQGRFDEAIGCLEQALAVRREDGHRAGEGRTLKNLGDTYIDLRKPKRALDYYGEALEIGREVGDRAREGQAQFGVGVSLLRLGEYAAAEAQLRGALAVLREVGDRPKEGRTLLRLGDAQRAQRRLVEAVASFTASLAIMRETSDRYHEGLALWHLGLTSQDQDDEAGQPAEAYWHQALTIFNELGATAEAEDVRQLLATAPQERDAQEGAHPAA